MAGAQPETVERRVHRRVHGAPPAALVTLIERFNPEAIDVPGGAARVRIVVRDQLSWDALVSPGGVDLRPAGDSPCEAELSADAATWQGIADDLSGGMAAFRAGRLRVRRSLHLGVGFLAATSGVVEPGGLRFASVVTPAGRLSTLSAGLGDPVVCIHGLGATKASFLPTVGALAGERRVIAVDLPGFGESDKPLNAAYDAPYFANAVTALLDSLEIESVDLIGNSMGGRVALEAGLLCPERVRRMALLAPALAWLRDRRWRWLLRGPLPKLGLIQPAPRVITEPIIRSLVPGGRDGWSAAGVDEFLRSYLTPRGRVAFYESARNIYLDEPHGEEGLWTRLAALEPETLFVWGRRDQLVPIGFRKHVERALPAGRHLELDCGHVPQLEAPEQTHGAIRELFAGR
jgi:pimeloyl-ACP methyl ester carboxylesterase